MGGAPTGSTSAHCSHSDAATNTNLDGHLKMKMLMRQSTISLEFTKKWTMSFGRVRLILAGSHIFSLAGSSIFWRVPVLRNSCTSEFNRHGQTDNIESL